MNPHFKKILVIQTAFIGDAILATAVLESIHKKFPEAELHILVRNGNESLFEQHPYLKKVWVWNKKQKKVKNLFGLIVQIRKQKFDWLINLHRFASSGLITVFSKARITCGFNKNPFSFLFSYQVSHIIGNGMHETERNHLLLKKYIETEVSKPKLYPSSVSFQKIQAYVASPFVCMAPASVWFTKQLPKQKWIELCDKTDVKNTIYLLGAKGDETLCKEIKASTTHKQIEVLCGTLSLLDSCALMQQAQMNYVNDSAPLHLASSVDAPVTAFFCSTIKEFGFYPLSTHSKIVEAIPAPSCRPCGLHGYKQCPKKHFDCGNHISIRAEY
ncbi:MAG: glycosyltransferase family 9 protein [Bacteroidetes bacterium]|nr:glycosyltransferase family 9 protein [Bacteroidota bacterium]